MHSLFEEGPSPVIVGRDAWHELQPSPDISMIMVMSVALFALLPVVCTA